MTNEATPARRTEQPGSSGPARSAKTRRIVTRSLIVVWVIVIGLLYFVPPFISYGSNLFVQCRPLSPAAVGSTTTNGFPSFWETNIGVDRSLEGWSNNTELGNLEAKLGGAEACAAVRTNQQTLLIIVIAAGLAGLLGLAIRNQNALLSLARRESTPRETP